MTIEKTQDNFFLARNWNFVWPECYQSSANWKSDLQPLKMIRLSVDTDNDWTDKWGI